jgi:ribonuclease HIII
VDIKDVLDLFPRIGSDEVGKGDFFGPLVVCSVFLESLSQIVDGTARDSKSLSDSRVSRLAPQLIKKVKYSVVKISPQKYNELYEKFGNINVILGWAHAQAIKNLLAENLIPETILIDKFGPEIRVLKHFDDDKIKKSMVFSPKAEIDPAVAAASIIARYTFLNEIKKMGRECGMEIPLGAGTSVDEAAKKLLGTIGQKNLSRYVKIHFKNYSRLG